MLGLEYHFWSKYRVVIHNTNKSVACTNIINRKHYLLVIWNSVFLNSDWEFDRSLIRILSEM